MRPPRRKLAGRIAGSAALVLACCLAAFGGCSGAGDETDGPADSAAGAPRPDADRPNVVLLMTDDQEVASLRVMPRTRRLLGGRGVTFTNALVSYPLCCPARATFLTGQHAHNHGVVDNRPPDGGYGKLDASEYLPIWLQRSGYLTAHVGKYLNDYMEEDGVPPGWDRWFGMVEPAARYFKAKFLDERGELHRTGTKPADYSTDLMTRKAVELIRELGSEDRPFYLSVGYVAPHVGKSQLERGHCDGKGPEPAPGTWAASPAGRSHACRTSTSGTSPTSRARSGSWSRWRAPNCARRPTSTSAGWRPCSRSTSRWRGSCARWPRRGSCATPT